MPIYAILAHRVGMPHADGQRVQGIFQPGLVCLKGVFIQILPEQAQRVLQQGILPVSYQFSGLPDFRGQLFNQFFVSHYLSC